MYDLKGSPCPNNGTTGDLDPVVAALRENASFDRAQVAWLMAQAQRWGYDVGYEQGQRDERELASIAADYAYTGSFSAENTLRDLKKRDRRREADAAARLPRPSDFRGLETPDNQVAA